MDAKIGATHDLTMMVSPTSLETAMADGTRRLVSGTYTLSAGGHQPHDPEGDSGTSGPCVHASVTLR